MLERPKVSVIVPAYNAGKFLHILLDSLDKQTNNNFQIVIVDDGSTDDTNLVASNYSCKSEYPIQLIRQENKGVSAARNTGLENSSGEFCIFIDSDDYVSPFFIEKLLKRQSETDADVVYCGFIRDGKNSAKNLPVHFEEGNILLLRMKRELLFHAGGALIRKNFLISNKIKFNTQLRLGEDLLFIYTILSKCTAYAVNEYLYFQTYRTNSVMNSAWTITNYEHHISAMTVIAYNISELTQSLPQQIQDEIHIISTRSILSAKIKLMWFLLSTKNYSKALSRLNNGLFTESKEELTTLTKKELRKYKMTNLRNVNIWRVYFFFKKNKI